MAGYGGGHPDECALCGSPPWESCGRLDQAGCGRKRHQDMTMNMSYCGSYPCERHSGGCYRANCIHYSGPRVGMLMLPERQMGCICPPTSEQTCQNPICPRKNYTQTKAPTGVVPCRHGKSEYGSIMGQTMAQTIRDRSGDQDEGV